eukprot:scaffold37_cov329-Pinguiococcus_pyrenoidosus.AAC.4
MILFFNLRETGCGKMAAASYSPLSWNLQFCRSAGNCAFPLGWTPSSVAASRQCAVSQRVSVAVRSSPGALPRGPPEAALDVCATQKPHDKVRVNIGLVSESPERH